MIKYFYKGQLMRTSKTRDDYKYALLWKGKDGSFSCHKCSTNKEYFKIAIDRINEINQKERKKIENGYTTIFDFME